jgi:hypothetical protein
MSLGRTRLFVAAVGAVCLALSTLSLSRIGGPEATRMERRDRIRLDQIREVARALICHTEGGGAEPAALGGVSGACLSPDRAAQLVDPLTGAAYGIARPSPGVVRVCAGFEAAARLGRTDWADPPFDRESGCVTAAARP